VRLGEATDARARVTGESPGDPVSPALVSVSLRLRSTQQDRVTSASSAVVAPPSVLQRILLSTDGNVGCILEGFR
jgi:hypothetical protein